MTRLFSKLDGAVLIIEGADQGFYLLTYRLDGSSSDTWHPTLADAKDQAVHDWKLARLDWHDVPESIRDLRAFGRANAI